MEKDIQFVVSNLWLLIASAFVFIMHLGFSTLEAGFTRSKNTVNILFKNVGVFPLGILSYAIVGFSIMYPSESFFGVFGFSGFGINAGMEGLTTTYSANYTYWTDFIFQAMFAATTATIVSGAIAERMKLSSFLLFSFLFLSLSYPITGMWKWGGGFLDSLSTPFYDFAGSTIVHSVGGWAALVAAIMIGPRLGRFENPNLFKPHNFSLATIGVFLLWFGWYGFNGGSVLSADPALLSLVFVTTTLGASAGAMTSMVASWNLNKRPDLTNVLNGILAGLVGITASADIITPLSAIIIGGIAGILVVYSVKAFEKFKIDDPVGAISVHLVCGVWGTLAVGIFSELASIQQVFSQLIGIASIGLFTVCFSFIALNLVKMITGGLRVTPEHESTGLDKSEHNEEAVFYSHQYSEKVSI